MIWRHCCSVEPQSAVGARDRKNGRHPSPYLLARKPFELKRTRYRERVYSLAERDAIGGCPEDACFALRTGVDARIVLPARACLLSQTVRKLSPAVPRPKRASLWPSSGCVNFSFSLTSSTAF